MNLSEEELAQIPIAPRATREVPYKKPVTFKISDDAAVLAIARMVVAGVDKQYHLFPYYREYVGSYGVLKAEELIAQAVSIPGACDIIQVDPEYAGIGLFGGLTEDSKKFVFHEWSGGTLGQLDISLTPQEARDIVQGTKEYITFYPFRYQFYFCIELGNLYNTETVSALLRSQDIQDAVDPLFTKKGRSFSLPEQDYEQGKGVYTQGFAISVGRKKFHCGVQNLHFPSFNRNGDKRICIILTVPKESKIEVSRLLPRDPQWNIQSGTIIY